jgi:NAD-dependent deacetylase
MKKIVVFTGAGVSAESGIKTFRDSGGLWEEYRIEDVATPTAWLNNPKLVLDFYNARRKQVMEAQPNAAHIALAELAKKYDVQIITQNIDDLHERAGSKKVLHLHGEIMKARSTKKSELVYNLKTWEIRFGDKCEEESQLRPHIVWFGEAVPNMEKAYLLTAKADVFVVIGTSLNVYPAADLVAAVPENCELYYIDPSPNVKFEGPHFNLIKKTASEGVQELVKKLM